jgi:hypothetical protein
MKRALTRRQKAAILVTAVTLCCYIGSYFATTEIFNGKIENDLIDLRLFDSAKHMAVFRPLILIEEQLRTSSEIEFYGHIKNGASLPTERSANELPQWNQ